MTGGLPELERVLAEEIPAPVAVAVSGGVDSMTLAYVAHRLLGERATMYHAVSPAVPDAATARVRAYAASNGWHLEIISAGEFDDDAYVANPANRCFYCKTNLYGSIASHSRGSIVSGTNLDDLSDWRPGLEAADDHAVRHPFVEAGIDKAGVRAIAAGFELDDIAELPAAPCLSSRVETGIPIQAPELRFIDAAERLVRDRVDARSVRCRIRRRGIVIELDAEVHDAMGEGESREISEAIARLAARHRVSGSIDFAPYRMGSAFLRTAK